MLFSRRMCIFLCAIAFAVLLVACGNHVTSQSYSNPPASSSAQNQDTAVGNNDQIESIISETEMPEPTPKEKPDTPFVGMKESEIQNTKLGVAALTYESGGFWGGESHTFHHYTFYYRYSTHTDVVFSCRAHNGVVDEIEDRRNAPISVDKDRHKTMIAAGVPVNYK